ncbi:hypothetical protein ZEAMMB73_Zm00001d015219 [Zea mays]|uniref:Uncharacterized protein n=1 Tax=Zea mays TaxID=4577 RepID=A0A1D6H074_MAIZE|nr:hypothetical protein ZEAMMB73_Zm00001d015219 [Zea mays]
MAWGEDEAIGPDVASAGLHISDQIDRDAATLPDLEARATRLTPTPRTPRNVPMSFPSVFPQSCFVAFPRILCSKQQQQQKRLILQETEAGEDDGKPSRMRQMMSMLMWTAEVLRMAPAKKNMPPISIEFLRPIVLIKWPNTRLERMAARYNEETNKNAWRNDSIRINPPEIKQNKLKALLSILVYSGIVLFPVLLPVRVAATGGALSTIPIHTNKTAQSAQNFSSIERLGMGNVHVIKWMFNKGQGKTMGSYYTLLNALIELFGMIFADMEELGVRPDGSIIRMLGDVFQKLEMMDKYEKLKKKYPPPKWEYRYIKGKRIRIRVYLDSKSEEAARGDPDNDELGEVESIHLDNELEEEASLGLDRSVLDDAALETLNIYNSKLPFGIFFNACLIKAAWSKLNGRRPYPGHRTWQSSRYIIHMILHCSAWKDTVSDTGVVCATHIQCGGKNP